jgi:hypothetical protein
MRSLVKRLESMREGTLLKEIDEGQAKRCKPMRFMDPTADDVN